MAIDFQGAAQVIVNTPDTLQVHFPLDSLAVGFLLVGFLFLVWVTWLVKKKQFKTSWLLIALSVFLLYFLLDSCAYRGTVTLSAAAQTITVEEHSFYYKRTNTFPLHSVERVVVKAGSSQNRELALVLTSGQEVSVGNGYGSRGGLFHAADLMNAFLSRSLPK